MARYSSTFADIGRAKAADYRARKKAKAATLTPISPEEEERALWWYHKQEQMRLEQELAEHEE